MVKIQPKICMCNIRELHAKTIQIQINTNNGHRSLVGLTIWIDIQVSSLPSLMEQKEEFQNALIVYPISLVFAVLVTIVSNSSIFLLPIRANYIIHKRMMSCLLQAALFFYAVNPAGRIINRFSQDISNLDDFLPFNLVYFLQTVILALAAFTLCFVNNAFLAPAIFTTIIICCGVARFFFKPAMDIKRLMSEAGSPLYSHFSNTLQGLRTIRVHKRQREFTRILIRY